MIVTAPNNAFDPQLVGRFGEHNVLWVHRSTPLVRAGLYLETPAGPVPLKVPPPSTDARGGYALAASGTGGLAIVNRHPPGPGEPVVFLWLPERTYGEQWAVGSRLVAWLNFEHGARDRTQSALEVRGARCAITDTLDRRQGTIGIVRQMPGGVPIEPEELWLGAIGAWVRTDGTQASFDFGRGYVYFGADDAAYVSRACYDWKLDHDRGTATPPASLDDPA